MAEIYVTGHKNPDTDSIVAAIAYANLKNSLGMRDYVAARIGSVNDETQMLLDRFGFEAPMWVKTMRTQVRDLEYDRTPDLHRSCTMDLAWRTMRQSGFKTIPIANDDGTLLGMLSAGDIASYDMLTINDSRLDDMPVFNLVSVLEGQLVNEYSNIVSSVSGSVSVAMPHTYNNTDEIGRDSVVICGDQPKLIDKLLQMEVNCIIICQTDIRREWAESTAQTCIISTPLDTLRVARLIFQAAPVERVCYKENIVAFHLNDYVDDVRETLLKSRFRCYPVLDEHDKVVGTLSRFHLLRPRRKQVVLVDHNEASQSVNGLDQVDVLEIIDHHRLADIQTNMPISVRNEPVGCTNTIITAMYQENGVVPSPKMAGLMASAILSDTVMFKSPTCTKKDIAMAERLAKIARINLDELGKAMFSVSSADKPAEELFMGDYKQFHISEQNIGVSQITCADSSALISRMDEFMPIMEKLAKEREFDMIILMITDILNEGSHLFYVGSDETIQQAFSVMPKDKHVFLPQVMSRKKQIIPMLTALWG